MDIPVLLERVEGTGYRARGLEPFGVTAEGATREEAIKRFRDLIMIRLQAGSEIVSVSIPAADNPWLRVIGTLDKDDPFVQDWEEIIKGERRKADEDPDYL